MTLGDGKRSLDGIEPRRVSGDVDHRDSRLTRIFVHQTRVVERDVVEEDSRSRPEGKRTQDLDEGPRVVRSYTLCVFHTTVAVNRRQDGRRLHARWTLTLCDEKRFSLPSVAVRGRTVPALGEGGLVHGNERDVSVHKFLSDAEERDRIFLNADRPRVEPRFFLGKSQGFDHGAHETGRDRNVRGLEYDAPDVVHAEKGVSFDRVTHAPRDDLRLGRRARFVPLAQGSGDPSSDGGMSDLHDDGCPPEAM